MVKSRQAEDILDILNIPTNSNNCNTTYLTGMTAVQKDYFSKHALAFRVLGIGWYIAFSIIACFFGGFWLDKHYDTAPMFSLLGVTLGLAVAMGGLYVLIRPLIREINSQDTKDTYKEDD